MRTTARLRLALLLTLVVTVPGRDAEAGDMRHERAGDRQQILDHIHSIFRAYIAKDRDTIRATHTDDWTGFLGPSTGIERGIEDYMRRADASLRRFNGKAYELLDTEIQLHGDLAVVFYVARYELEDQQGKARRLMLRSVDLYRREGGAWIQFGSHITPLPEGGLWGAGSDSVEGSRQEP